MNINDQWIMVLKLRELCVLGGVVCVCGYSLHLVPDRPTLWICGSDLFCLSSLDNWA